MKKKPKPEYSVGMSKETGCIVMVRTNGKNVTVIGSLTRDDSLDFVKQIMQWSDRTIREESRIAYNH
jgi:hypothetical protein